MALVVVYPVYPKYSANDIGNCFGLCIIFKAYGSLQGADLYVNKRMLHLVFFWAYVRGQGAGG